LFSPVGAERACGFNVEAHVDWSKGRNVFDSQREQSRRRMEPSTIGWMPRAGVLFFQMHKGSGDLDEAFEVEVVFAVAFQPEVFQDIMGLVVVTPVEALEVARIAWMQAADVRGFEGFDKG
jgi:hypothetical protein